MPIKRYVSALVLVPLLILTSFVGTIADPAAPSDTIKSADTQPRAAPSGTSDAKEADAPGSAQTPVKPFTPSETISADSAISFPVDI
jgi:hypothetical protein